MTIQSANVTFGQGSGGEGALPSMGFRLLVVDDYLGRRLGVGEGEGPQIKRVTAENFNETMAELAPHLLMDVPNRLGGVAKELTVDLMFKNFEDLRPEWVAAHQPECARWLELRRKIEALLEEGLPAGQIVTRIEAEAMALPGGPELLPLLSQSKPPTGAGGEGGEKGSGGGLLDEITETTNESGESGGSALDAVMGSISGQSKRLSKNAQGALGWIDQRLSAQLDEILHAPGFRAVEAAWRGLRLLVERSDFRKAVVIEILPAAKEDLRRLLIEGALEMEWAQPGEPPLGAVIIAHGFDYSARDLTLLQEIAQACERLQAPVAAEAAPAFFNLETLHPLGTKGSLQGMLSDPVYAKWMGVRQQDPARWLGLCVNRILLRRPWGSDGETTKGFDYEERCDEAKSEGLLWGAASLALASCMTSSFARTGWPHFVSGAKEGAVENLHLRAWEARPGVTANIPTETGFSDMHAQDLATAGLIPLQAAGRNDKAYFTYVPSALMPKRYSDAGATQDAALKSTLPYQLYAGRVAAWLNRVVWQGSEGADAETLARVLENKVGELFAPSGGQLPEDCVKVTVEDHPEDASRYLVNFEIQPPFKIFNVRPRLELTVVMAR